jgi:nucleotide-binding universal stress UspA family protein
MNGPSVVFGVDFCPVMRRAIPWVREFIARDAPNVLVHAIDEAPLPGFLRHRVPLSLAEAAVSAQVIARLQSLAARTGAYDAECVTRAGRADKVLEDVARERSASLLVIGAHGVPTRPWRRVGTVTERLLRSADQPLLVVNGVLTGAPKRILVAVDDAKVTPCVLARAGALADTHGAELHAIHVLSPAAYNHMISAEAAQGGGEAAIRCRIEADLADATLRWLRAVWANTHHHSGLQAHVAHGTPADEILRAARDRSADLIVIGRYGVGQVIPAVLGSVVGSVVAGSESPVLVVT